MEARLAEIAEGPVAAVLERERNERDARFAVLQDELEAKLAQAAESLTAEALKSEREAALASLRSETRQCIESLRSEVVLQRAGAEEAPAPSPLEQERQDREASLLALRSELDARLAQVTLLVERGCAAGPQRVGAEGGEEAPALSPLEQERQDREASLLALRSELDARLAQVTSLVERGCEEQQALRREVDSHLGRLGAEDLAAQLERERSDRTESLAALRSELDAQLSGAEAQRQRDEILGVLREEIRGQLCEDRGESMLAEGELASPGATGDEQAGLRELQRLLGKQQTEAAQLEGQLERLRQDVSSSLQVLRLQVAQVEQVSSNLDMDVRILKESGPPMHHCSSEPAHHAATSQPEQLSRAPSHVGSTWSEGRLASGLVPAASQLHGSPLQAGNPASAPLQASSLPCALPRAGGSPPASLQASDLPGPAPLAGALLPTSQAGSSPPTPSQAAAPPLRCAQTSGPEVASLQAAGMVPASPQAGESRQASLEAGGHSARSSSELPTQRSHEPAAEKLPLPSVADLAPSVRHLLNKAKSVTAVDGGATPNGAPAARPDGFGGIRGAMARAVTRTASKTVNMTLGLPRAPPPPVVPMNLNEYLLRNPQDERPYEHPVGYKAEPDGSNTVLTHRGSGVKLWSTPIQLAGASDTDLLLYYYTDQASFRAVSEASEALIALLQQARRGDAEFGAGVYMTIHAPEHFATKSAILTNMHSNAEDRATQLQHIEPHCGSADYCIPFLVRRCHVRDVMSEATPEMASGAGFTAAGERARFDRDIRVVRIDPVEEAVRQLEGDPAPVVRARAAKALRELALRGDSRAVGALLPRLAAERDTTVRAAAAGALGEVAQRGDPQACEALRRCLRVQGNVASVREAAALAIGKVAQRGDPQTVEALARCLDSDPDRAVRAGAAFVLGRIALRQDVRAVEALTYRFEDEDEDERVSAVAGQALKRLGMDVEVEEEEGVDEKTCVIS